MSVTALNLVSSNSREERDAKIAAIREASKTKNYFPAAFIKAAAIAIARKESPNLTQENGTEHARTQRSKTLDQKTNSLTERFTKGNNQRPFITYNADTGSFEINLHDAPEGMNKAFVEKAIREKIGRMGFAPSGSWMRQSGTGIISVSSPAFKK